MIQAVDPRALEQMRLCDGEVIADNVLTDQGATRKMMVEFFPNHQGALIATPTTDDGPPLLIGKAPVRSDSAERIRRLLLSDPRGITGLREQLALAVVMDSYAYKWDHLHREPFDALKANAPVLIELNGRWETETDIDVDGVFVVSEGQDGTVFAKCGNEAVELGHTNDTAGLITRIDNGDFALGEERDDVTYLKGTRRPCDVFVLWGELANTSRSKCLEID